MEETTKLIPPTERQKPQIRNKGNTHTSSLNSQHILSGPHVNLDGTRLSPSIPKAKNPSNANGSNVNGSAWLNASILSLTWKEVFISDQMSVTLFKVFSHPQIQFS